jgi:hypothetical protein
MEMVVIDHQTAQQEMLLAQGMLHPNLGYLCHSWRPTAQET